MPTNAPDGQLVHHALPALVAAGLQPVLLREKRPWFKDWQARLMDLRELQFWTRREVFNLGIHLGASGLAVIDKDKATEKSGSRREAYRWEQRHGVTSAKTPLAVETASGVHTYWRLPATVRAVRSRIRHAGGPDGRKLPLDILMAERVAVFPPSFVAETSHRYAFRPGKRLVPVGDLPLLPESVVAELNADGRSGPKPVALIPLDADGGHLRYVERIDPAVQGADGSTACVKACLKILSLTGGDVGRAWPLALHYNRTRCDPPFDEEVETGPDSLRRKLLVARSFWKPR